MTVTILLKELELVFGPADDVLDLMVLVTVVIVFDEVELLEVDEEVLRDEELGDLIVVVIMVGFVEAEEDPEVDDVLLLE